MNAWNKDLARRQFECAGLPIPVGRAASADLTDDELAKLLADLDGDVIVKPVTGGSTLGVNRAQSTAQLRSALLEAGGPVLVETRLDGPEFAVAVVGDRALPPVMIQSSDSWFGYAAKYQPHASVKLCPAPISAELDERLRDTALAATRMLGFGERAYARVDLMQDAAGVPRCLEVNAMPGLTPYSLLPLAAKACGWTFPDLIARLVELGRS